jgi:hypothetical protein
MNTATKRQEDINAEEEGRLLVMGPGRREDLTLGSQKEKKVKYRRHIFVSFGLTSSVYSSLSRLPACQS